MVFSQGAPHSSIIKHEHHFRAKKLSKWCKATIQSNQSILCVLLFLYMRLFTWIKSQKLTFLFKKKYNLVCLISVSTSSLGSLSLLDDDIPAADSAKTIENDQPPNQLPGRLKSPASDPNMSQSLSDDIFLRPQMSRSKF